MTFLCFIAYDVCCHFILFFHILVFSNVLENQFQCGEEPLRDFDTVTTDVVHNFVSIQSVTAMLGNFPEVNVKFICTAYTIPFCVTYFMDFAGITVV